MATQKQPGRTVVPDPMGTIELFDPTPYQRQAWLTKFELSQLLSVSERTIERKISAGIWPCHRDGPHWLRFSPSDVDAIEGLLGRPNRSDSQPDSQAARQTVQAVNA